jgi:hypothetical protein
MIARKVSIAASSRRASRIAITLYTSSRFTKEIETV